MEKKEYKIDGLHCQNCALRVKNALEKVQGIDKVSISQEEERLSVFANEQPDIHILNDLLEELGNYSISET